MSQPTLARVMARADEAHAKIASHEELCAERYAGIHSTLGELKEAANRQSALLWGIILSVAGATLLILITVVVHAAGLS